MSNALKKLLVYDAAAPLIFTGGQFLLWFSLFYIGLLAIRRSHSCRLGYLTAFSWFFYYKSSGHFLLALIATTAIDYFLSRRIAASSNPRLRRALLTASILLSGGTLLYFKYTNFLLGGVADLVSMRFTPLDIALPAGISFYTFESISYVVDVYRNRLQPARNFLEYATYLAYFPHLMAGPIMRASDLLPELRSVRELDGARIGSGLFLVLSGLLKKAVVADYLARFSDIAFSGAAGMTGLEVLLGVYCYAVQIYCDFSGYSDMAIGLGRMCGVDLPVNFRSPYGAHSITDFWHRWHITLSSWLRDYIYIPLGGSRKGLVRTHTNVLLTMLIGGLWHGAAMKFVLWGAAHGALLAVERQFTARLLSLHATRFGRIVGILVTFHVVTLLWVPLRARDLDQALAMLTRIWVDFRASAVPAVVEARAVLLLVLLLGMAICLVSHELTERWAQRFSSTPAWARAMALVLVVQAVLQTRTADVQPFIYFQF